MTLRTSPPRKKSVPSVERLGIASVKPGSLPHHWRISSLAAAVQRVWPVTMQIVSPARMFSADGFAERGLLGHRAG